MMDYIDLLDDSDEDIPLIPTKKDRPQTQGSSSILPRKAASTVTEPIELSSSDDDVPILKRPSHNCSTGANTVAHLPKLPTAGLDSDGTEEYSNSTEKYNWSSDLESLPDINDPDPPNGDFQRTKDPAVEILQTAATASVQPDEIVPTDTLNTEYTQLKSKKPTTAKAAERALERDKVRQQKILIQQEKKEEKERKILEKKRDVAMRNAEREAKRAAQPGECHRHMLLEVDKQLDNTSLGICISAMCTANCVPLKYISTPVSNAVMFKRKLVSPESSTTSYVLEDNMAVILPMSDIVELVLSGLSGGHRTLHSYIENVRRVCHCKPTMIVFGCEKYFRTLNTQRNRVHKDNVLGPQIHSKKNKEMPVITRLQYEEAVTALQMTSDTVFINLEVEEDVARAIFRLNKSIAEAPVKRGKYEQQALSVKTTGLKIGKNSEGCLKVWQRMLQEFRNISADVSGSIIAEWPSPYLLYQEYERCRDCSQAELLLQDIQIRRGGGVVQTTRRVGKETSRRIYELFTKHADFVIK